MAKVTNRDSFGNEIPFDQMLRKFKKQVEKDEILFDLKKHEYFLNKKLKKLEKHKRLMRKLHRH